MADSQNILGALPPLCPPLTRWPANLFVYDNWSEINLWQEKREGPSHNYGYGFRGFSWKRRGDFFRGTYWCWHIRIRRSGIREMSLCNPQKIPKNFHGTTESNVSEDNLKLRIIHCNYKREYSKWPERYLIKHKLSLLILPRDLTKQQCFSGDKEARGRRKTIWSNLGLWVSLSWEYQCSVALV